jgi:hypothetical protein
MFVVHNGEAGAARNNEKPCTGGPESERSYRWPPRPASQDSFLRRIPLIGSPLGDNLT